MAQPAIVLQLEELISRTTVSQGPSGTSTLQDAPISEVQLDANSAQVPSGASGSPLQDAASEVSTIDR